MPKPEPFGYFRAEPFGWTDCSETDDGAMALYDQAAVDALERERDDLALIIATDTGTESAVADLQRQLVAVTAERDELRFALENVRLFAARNRKEVWALLILGFCAEGGVVGSVTR